MYAKALGLLMLVLGSSGAGLAIASGYSFRVRELAAARAALAMLETEVCYSLRPLAGALKGAASRATGPAEVLFRTAAANLEAGQPAPVAWAEGVRAALCESALTRDDAEVLASIGAGLGTSSASDQRRRLRDAAERLGMQEAEARDRRGREGKLWGYAGVFGGLALAALLA